MDRAVIFCNGEIKDYDYHNGKLKSSDYIIAVDGGGRHCKALNLQPHLALGDFDSLDKRILDYYRRENVEILEFPCDKNYIDLALALDVALKRGYENIVVYGALGGKRIDMELANLLLISRYEQDIRLEDENRWISLIYPGKDIVIKNRKSYYFSLIPLSARLITAASAGLKYQLLDLEFSIGETRSISNEIVADYCQVAVKEGRALAICQKK